MQLCNRWKKKTECYCFFLICTFQCWHLSDCIFMVGKSLKKSAQISASCLNRAHKMLFHRNKFQRECTEILWLISVITCYATLNGMKEKAQNKIVACWEWPVLSTTAQHRNVCQSSAALGCSCAMKNTKFYTSCHFMMWTFSFCVLFFFVLDMHNNNIICWHG